MTKKENIKGWFTLVIFVLCLVGLGHQLYEDFWRTLYVCIVIVIAMGVLSWYTTGNMTELWNDKDQEQ